MNVLDLDATALAKLIKEGEFSAVEATEAYIDQITRINPQLNCFVQDRFDEARAEAARCDAQLKAIFEDNGQSSQLDELGPLFGVPVTIKDSFDIKGLATTGGLTARRAHVALEDSFVVEKLKQAGAIFLGKTNTPTLCFCQESDNKLYGRTNNPWHLGHTAGGSSGGEGALNAAGGAAVGIGSDIGGSIRFPAHFNGVVGFKSGANTVSADGHFAISSFDLQLDMLGMGGMAKSVRDAQLIHTLLVQEQGEPLSLEDYTLASVQEKDQELLNRFEVMIPEPHPNYPMGDETAQLLTKIHSVLSAEGYNVRANREAEQCYPSSFTRSALLWQLVMSYDGAQALRELAFQNKESLHLEYLKERLLGSSAYHRYLLWAFIGANLFKPSAKKLQQIRVEIDLAKEEIKQILQHSIMIIPIYHRPAPPHGKLYQEIFSPRKTYQKYMPYIAFPNLLGLPSLTVPVGEDSQGLPIAVQIVGINGNEKAIFAYGRVLEQHFRGYVRCTTYDQV